MTRTDLEVPPEEDEGPEGGVPEAGGGQPISARCSRRFTAVHNSGTRPLSRITHIVIHSTEGDTAAGAATWFANPASGGSAHVVVDDHQCFRTLEDRGYRLALPGQTRTASTSSMRDTLGGSARSG